VNLEKRVAKLDEWAATVKHHGDQIDGLLGDIERNRKLVARVEALETWNEDAAATVRNVLQCLDDTKAINRALMTRVEELEDHRVFAVDREYDRQARWHATRDAYVAGRGPDDADADVEVWAKEFADRAHGPLEAKARQLDSEMRKHVAAEIEAEDRNVNALVKAAKEMQENLHEIGVVHHSWTSAIKPFELEVDRG
jgi:hypothetical protein